MHLQHFCHGPLPPTNTTRSLLPNQLSELLADVSRHIGMLQRGNNSLHSSVIRLRRTTRECEAPAVAAAAAASIKALDGDCDAAALKRCVPCVLRDW
jgi:hypothetical protein